MIAVLPGDFGLVGHNSLASPFIRLAQLLYGDASEYSHAFIVTDGLLGDIIEAQAGGIQSANLSKYPADRLIFSHFKLSTRERKLIVNTALGLVGTPYGFSDYVALALHHWGFDWMDKRVKTNKRMICSQMVDYCYQQAGVHLFNDNRLPGYVPPGDLVSTILQHQTREEI